MSGFRYAGTRSVSYTHLDGYKRQPLTAIRSLSETLHDDPTIEAADRQRLTAIVIAESERLSRLIDQILDMAKIRSGQVHWRQEAVDLGAVVREALASMQPILRDKGVQTAAILPAAGPVTVSYTHLDVYKRQP